MSTEQTEPTAEERRAWGRGGGPRFPYDAIRNPDGYMEETAAEREVKPRKYRITIERVVVVDGIGAKDAVAQARRHSIDINSSIVRVEELIPQPDLTKTIEVSEWAEEAPGAQR